ncbi:MULTISPECIES: hypothetical protein [Brevibacillus]|uniref:hypothetical protein n=1 Tax=Brevibacillus TaxID=55080 RepID=UPI001C8DD0AF|nr:MULTISPECIES: hypothetical protein [Brevibacillus]MBY0087115.1 hypothetical protein [Brevibacillus brevis]MCE0453496.1 hypothetical protein [Brevibacillus sp. AF8]
MLTDYALKQQTNALESIFHQAEVEIDGNLFPATLEKTRQGPSKITILVRIQAKQAGLITKRIVKDLKGEVVWQDNVNITKPEREIAISIPIEVNWKVGG